jgi:hypothetical protein
MTADQERIIREQCAMIAVDAEWVHQQSKLNWIVKPAKVVIEVNSRGRITNIPLEDKLSKGAKRRLVKRRKRIKAEKQQEYQRKKMAQRQFTPRFQRNESRPAFNKNRSFTPPHQRPLPQKTYGRPQYRR